MRKTMGKIFLPMLLAVSLACGTAGCGKSESASGGDAVDLGTFGGGDAVDLGTSGGGDAVDLTGTSGGGDAVDLTGAPGDGSEGRQIVEGDSVTVKVPAISYEDFGNGFYDEYVVDYEPLLERTYDADGLLTSARIIFDDVTSMDPADARIMLSYEKSGGMVTGCELSADMYGWYKVCDQDYTASGGSRLLVTADEARENNNHAQRRMPYRLTFSEPTEANPDVVKEAVIAAIDGYEERLHGAILPNVTALDFCEAFKMMYLEAFSPFSDTEQTEADEEVEIGPRIRDRFRKRREGSELAGGLGGEMVISNDPGWVIGMNNVSHEEIICQIETEQDSAGNITLVHRYNDYASYDHVFTYDGAGRMIQCDYYEYSNGQSREAVGVNYSTTYSYDGAGHLVKIERLGTQANRVDSTAEYSYDDMGRVVTRKSTSGYHGNDYMTAQQECNSVAWSYEYDDAGKVICAGVTMDWAKTALHPDPPAPTTVMYRPVQ